MELRELHSLTSHVNGWLTKKEGEILYQLASQSKNRGAVVEVGSWQGKSTIYIAHALREHEKPPAFYAVDPHVGSEEHWVNGKKVWTFDAFKKNIEDAGIADLVTPIVKYSTEFAQEMSNPVEFIFIDGAHDYDNVEKDFLAWYPKVVDGGVMAFHDTYAGGDPYKVLRKYVYPSRHFGLVRRVDSITYVTKLRNGTIFDYVHNLVNRVVEDMKPVLYKNTAVRRLVSSIK